MWICLNLPHGQRRCFWIPIYYEIPKGPRIPDPGPLHYGEMIADATILATINAAAKHIADEGARRALEGGVAASLKSMQAKAGEGFSMSLEAPRQG
jgi:hypothetical protein